jgi:4-alpha-glucanotransferase
LLREKFDAGHDHEALHKFQAEGGIGLQRHAIFEALAATLTPGNPSAHDWRNWPAAYQNPENPAIARFCMENPAEIEFHTWLQMLADQGIAEAQQAARQGGAKIGLIADLAVGTDHAGSHSWSRQQEVLKGLEIGAPPDLINREGQSWGITAFSPRGLRNSGFSAFIEMLRHALRHAGGVRIDHVMGLARLWVIPQGFSSARGAYLQMPVRDLMRLVTLESHRHRAVILGEDLGTLPHGFGAHLDAAGISGLRVMWFERDGQVFKPPASWTPTAVAMTTTHDLPTISGWWEGRDILLREALLMAGDGLDERIADRASLWQAFQESGATAAPEPPNYDGAAVTYVACAHLGRAACTLALLPVEDALSLVDQPNVPGTTDQHPNWRRRLPGDAETLFAREDFIARLAILAASRRG